MWIKNRFDAVLPAYTRIPLALVVCCNWLAYFATRLITRGMTHHDLSLPLDGMLPFVPAFVVFYILAYVQWVVGYILIARESRELCYRVLSGEIIAKLICLALFVLLPTTMTRAEITSDGLFSGIVNVIYRTDAADNLFPSIHCLESWVCFRGALRLKKVGPWYRYVSLVFSLLVFTSTVLIKQHVIVDILAGVAVYELGRRIADKTNFAAVFQKINGRFLKKADLENVHEEV